MALRQTIGISLALLMISTAASAKDREHHLARHHHVRTHIRHERRAVARSHAARHTRSRRHRTHAARSLHSRHTAALHASAGVRDSFWGPVHPIRKPRIVRAHWYHLVGDLTADGERLDRATPTAAHRTLPFGTLLRVTDLDNGRSVVVRINDRGPWTRGVALDLSPRAAQLLHMKRAGIATVRIQRQARGPAPHPMTFAASMSTVDE